MHVSKLPGNFDSEGTILHPGSRALFRHWEATRGANPCPTREHFSLAPIQAQLPQIFILDRDNRHATYRFRLAGTGIGTLLRHEPTGLDALDGWDRFERDVLMRALDLTASKLIPSVLRMRFATDRRDIIGVEMIALPVRRKSDGPAQVMGGIFLFSDVGRLIYDSIEKRELVTTRMIRTEHAVADKRASFGPGAAFRVIQGGLG
jgi:hypothetical protein